MIGETNFSDGLNIFWERLWDLSWITAELQDPHCSQFNLGPFMDNSRTNPGTFHG